MLKFILPSFINTSEAYTKSIIIGLRHAVIPYINLNLLPENPIKKGRLYIDYSYVLFYHIKHMSFNTDSGKFSIDFANDGDTDLVEYVAMNNYYRSNGGEVCISCGNSELIIPNNFNHMSDIGGFTHKYYSSRHTLLQKEKCDSFFSSENLPTEIVEVIGEKSWSLEV